MPATLSPSTLLTTGNVNKSTNSINSISGNNANSGKPTTSFNDMLAKEIKTQEKNKQASPSSAASTSSTSSPVPQPIKNKKTAHVKTEQNQPSQASQEAGAAAMANTALSPGQTNQSRPATESPTSTSNQPISGTNSTSETGTTTTTNTTTSTANAEADSSVDTFSTTLANARLMSDANAMNSATEISSDAQIAANAAGLAQSDEMAHASQRPAFSMEPTVANAVDQVKTGVTDNVAESPLQQLMNSSGMINKEHSLDENDKKITFPARADSTEEYNVDATSENSVTTEVNTVLRPSEEPAFSDKPLTTSLPEQTIKAANQGLNAGQLNAIAPVLSTPGSAEKGNVVTDILRQPVGTPEWDTSVGQKISWMVAGGHQTASLTLNPPDLGPLQVVLSVSEHHANATFIAHQPEVRTALENAIPKLREMMEQSGIQLGECNVNSQPKQQQEFTQSQRSSGRVTATNNESKIDSITSTQTKMTHTGTGMVDTFV